MQFYFPEEARRSEILGILCFWVLEYHVDGFHLLGENLPVDMLAAGEALAQSLEAKGIPAERIRKYGFAFRGKEVLIGS